MDEQERLIARAALCDAAEASLAWTELRSRIDVREASPVLSWAGGYIQRNLESVGINEPYLAGIARHNWFRNNLLLAKAQGVLAELAAGWTIVPLKSFGLSADLSDRGLRPLADIDVYVDSTDVAEVVALLRSRGFVPHLQLSEREFVNRILPQRGSWNFHHADGVDVDIHWKVFDHLDASHNARLVRANSSEATLSFGKVRQLSPELMVVIMSVQQQIQDATSLSALFDIDNLLRHVNSHRLVSVARSAQAHDALRQTVLAIAAIHESRPDYLEAVLAELPVVAMLTPRVVKRRLFRRAPRDAWNATLVRNRLVYWTWWKLGQVARAERVLIRVFGPFSRGEISVASDGRVELDFCDLEYLGPGWHHVYPGQDFRWANQPESRFVLAVEQGGALSIEIAVDETMWAQSPVETVSVYLDGIRVSDVSYRPARARFTIPSRSQRRRFEVSFRSDRHVRFVNAGIHSNWYELAVPVTRLTSSPAEG